MDVFASAGTAARGGGEMLQTIARTGVFQPTPAQDANGMFECNWTNPYVLAIPSNWVSGVYLVN